MKYKVLEEYDRFYLGVSERGYKECFDKRKYKPDQDGYIEKNIDNNYADGVAPAPDKINKNFIKL